MASPAASATGPARCSPMAGPKTMGNNGSTHGESVDSTPAAKARPILPMAAASDRLVQQRLDRGRIGIPGRAPDFLCPPEGNERALPLHPERAQEVFLGIE